MIQPRKSKKKSYLNIDVRGGITCKGVESCQRRIFFLIFEAVSKFLISYIEFSEFFHLIKLLSKFCFVDFSIFHREKNQCLVNLKISLQFQFLSWSSQVRITEVWLYILHIIAKTRKLHLITLKLRDYYCTEIILS